MKKWLKLIRGAVGMGVTWAVGWSAIGAVFGLVYFFRVIGLGSEL